jgi:hypothetical protein
MSARARALTNAKSAPTTNAESARDTTNAESVSP